MRTGEGFPTAVSNQSLAWVLVAVTLVTVSVMGAVTALQSPPLKFTASASGDTYLSSYAPETPDGTATVLWVSNGGGFINWTLIQFNILGKLRPTDLVMQATMKLTVSDASAPTWPVVLTTGRTLKAWGENSTTFSSAPKLAFDTSTSTVIGTDGAPSPGDTLTIDVSKQLRRWQSYGGPSNFGTVLLFGPDIGEAAIGLASRENPQLGHPVLEVTFRPGPRTIYGDALDPFEIALARTE